MISMILICLAVTTVICAFSVVIYRKQVETLQKIGQQQEMLANLHTAIRGLGEEHKSMSTRVNHLATDVIQREIFQNPDDRHQSAIKSARLGKDALEIARLHGLTADEATLIISLYAPVEKVDENSIRNANLAESIITGVV